MSMHHAVDGRDALLLHQPQHVAEAALDQDQPAGMGLGQGAAGGNGMGVAVDGDHPAVGGGEDRPAVAAGAEGTVDIEAAIAGRERLQHLVEHDRHMRRFGGGVIDGHGAENQGEQGVKIHADNAHGSLNKWFQI